MYFILQDFRLVAENLSVMAKYIFLRTFRYTSTFITINASTESEHGYCRIQFLHDCEQIYLNTLHLELPRSLTIQIMFGVPIFQPCQTIDRVKRKSMA
jgi:hypothetical protein